ncbi:glycerol-3-phosphate acyltransferase 1, mitochondrial isoform X2 [Ceratina calcarata]|uniref:Glycerol-3-phosphate acyltransferase 1, mitochondrial isoform X2 n=1 Tax=Ceratina calcarata TaxID=156304 RepID=A0AAJ7JCZ8_9HYME|nr:glycerol-3-phosphate acyltransferase 1, mitochondrial isoform X2 [Ceratina calcarata]
MDGFIEVFLFFGVLFYFFNFRASNMVDIVSTRLQEVYANWETRTEVKRNPESARYSIDELRRIGQQSYRKKIHDREQARKIRQNSLFRIKETEPFSPLVKNKPSFLHYCCNSCTPASRNLLVNTINKQHMPFGQNLLVVNPGVSLFSKVFYYISHVSNLKEYDYPKVTQTVLEDERLKDAIKLAAWETASNENCSEKDALAKAKARAKTILENMEAKSSNLLLKITTWLLYKLLPCFIKSAVVLPSQIEMLNKANEAGLPLILLPLHRSHLDYIMMSFILVVNNIRTPLIAAGDNLRIPFFGRILRCLGAFFIKRRIDPVAGRKDVLYRATLHTYIMESLRAGHNIEVFIEGGRTRTGKPCMPKGGILSVILDAYMDGIIEDALLVPVAINYDRLVDGNFVREQLGQPKKMETFLSTIKAIWSTLRGDYGIVKVDFCQPFSLREMLKYFQNQQNKLVKTPPSQKTLKSTMSSSSLYGTDVIAEEYRLLVDSIARHVVYDCTSSMPIMSTNVVAFLLLNKFRDGCTLDKLVEAFDAMRNDLEVRDKDVAFCGESIDIVNHALDILGPGLVKQQRQEITEAVDGQLVKSNFITAIRPVSILPNVIELSYYSNTVLTCYIMDSVVVTSLYAELQSQIHDSMAITENNITVSKNRLIERSLKLCDILKYEFIFCKPCQEIEHLIAETIDNLSYTDMINLVEEVHLQEEEWSKRYARNFDDSSDEEYHNTKPRDAQYKVNLISEHAQRMEFLHVLLRPLIDTYTFSAFTLRKLVGRSLAERDLVQEVLSELKTNLDRGIVNYGESLCVDPIKNSLKLFEKWNVLECHSQENVKIFYLKDEYDTDSATTKIFDTIATFKWTRNVD